MNIDAYFKLKEEVGEQVKIVAVSKKQPDEKIRTLIEAGHPDFGENYVQELVNRQEKFSSYPVNWHFIGHLQSNKVKFIVPFIHLIQSVDSLKLLMIINKEAEKINRVIDCLLQIHIAQEETKFGLNEEETIELLESQEFLSLKNIRITGLMGMASFTSQKEQVRKEFRMLRRFFEQIKKDYFAGKPEFKELSTGMSDDYQIAVEEGSTMIRIGTLIFGARNYQNH